MDDNTEGMFLDGFCSTRLEKKLDDIKLIVNDLNYEGSKESSINKILQSCIEMMNVGKNALECMENKSCMSSIIVTDLIAYEKGVIASFKHCSESNIIYGDSIVTVKQLLTELFKKTSEIQTLWFKIFEKIEFDLTLEEDLSLMLNALQHIWYGAVTVYNVSNKMMVSYWKVYITLSQKYSAQLKENIVNDEPIDFLCTEMKKIILSFHHNDEVSLKLVTYMMSVLVKLCSYGCVLKSHTILVEFILFLNSYWLSDTQDAVAVKNRLLQFVDQLVLISDETFVKVFQSKCQDIINSNSTSQKISALYIIILLLKRLSKITCNQQAYEIICLVFKLLRCSDSMMGSYNVDSYESLLINSASVILVSECNLFKKIEKLLIQNILNTDYWPAMFSSDLWIIIMRYLSPDLCSLQFSKLARLLEALIDFPCFTQCPEHIYLETLLRRHFALITDKKKLVNSCPQLQTPSLKSVVGILHVPTLSKFTRLSEMVKIITTLSQQKNNEHLNRDIIHLWNCVRDEYPPKFLCALVEFSIGSETLLKTIIPKGIKILSVRADDDTTEMKRCRLRLIRSILLHTPTFQENLILEIFLEYLNDNHPLVRQWTVETIVYLFSVTLNQNNLMSMLFKQSKIRTILTDYLEMKINNTYNDNDLVQYFEKLSLYGKFQHTCSFDGKLERVLDKLKADIDCLNDNLTKIKMSKEEWDRLKEYSSLLNNICTAKQYDIENN